LRVVTKLARSWRICVLFRYAILRSILRMASLRKKIDTERRVRDWLDENGVPQPGSVEYGYHCIRLFWHDSKTVLVVDIDKPAEDGLDLYLKDLEAGGN
jgi:hypothetical protein